MKHLRHLGGWFLLVGIAIMVTASYWRYLDTHPSTDNAYLNTFRTDISSNVSGQVTTVLIKDNQFVTQGELLFTIDDRPYQLALEKAKAALDLTEHTLQAQEKAVQTARAKVQQAKAELEYDQKNATRIAQLVHEGKASLAEGDRVKAKVAVSLANSHAANSLLQQAIAKRGALGSDNATLRQAKANLEQAKLDLSYTKITAPSSGKITHLSLQPGGMLQRGQTVCTLLDQNNWWVDANFKETQLKNIKPGQTAIVTLDMTPNHPLYGTVESISGGTGASFSILPPENATGNWVKVTQRVPVKIALAPTKAQLIVGASASVTVDTTSK